MKKLFFLLLPIIFLNCEPPCIGDKEDIERYYDELILDIVESQGLDFYSSPKYELLLKEKERELKKAC